MQQWVKLILELEEDAKGFLQFARSDYQHSLIPAAAIRKQHFGTSVRRLQYINNASALPGYSSSQSNTCCQLLRCGVSFSS